MNLIELIRTTAYRLGLPPPNGVIGSNDRMINQMHALLTQLGCDLITQYDWRRLYREHFVTTRAVVVSATMTKGSKTLTMSDASSFDDKWMASGRGMPPFNVVQERTGNTTIRMREPATETGTFDLTFSQYAYPLPSDWHRQVPQTEWRKNGQGNIKGPKTPQEWQKYKAGNVYPGSLEMFRLIGNSIHILPPPPNGITFSFEYISKNWVVSDGGNTSRPEPTSDNDMFIFSDSLLMTGLVARWFDVHGLDSTVEKAEFASLLGIAKAQDKSAPLLSITKGGAPAYINSESVPEGNWSV